MNDRYEITSLIGKGRTGGVYEAIDSVLSRKVALRRFFSERGNTDTSSWADVFSHLTGHLTRFNHPSLLIVYDAGIDDDGAYMITEYVKHPKLKDRLLQGRLELKEFWELARQILEALTEPHSEGFAHSGLSTNSIMLQARSRGDIRYRLIDLGHLWLIPLINPENPALRLSDPSIMAPELFEGLSSTPATDVYMLGMLLYQGLAGGNPLAGLPMEDAYQKHKSHGFAPVTGYRTSVPPEVAQWLELLTQAEPQNRPQTANAALSLMPDIRSIDPIYFEQNVSKAVMEKAEPVALTQPQPQHVPQPAAQNAGFTHGPSARNRSLPKPMASAQQNNTAVIITVVCLALAFLILLLVAL